MRLIERLLSAKSRHHRRQRPGAKKQRLILENLESRNPAAALLPTTALDPYDPLAQPAEETYPVDLYSASEDETQQLSPSDESTSASSGLDPAAVDQTFSDPDSSQVTTESSSGSITSSSTDTYSYESDLFASPLPSSEPANSGSTTATSEPVSTSSSSSDQQTVASSSTSYSDTQSSSSMETSTSELDSSTTSSTTSIDSTATTTTTTSDLAPSEEPMFTAEGEDPTWGEVGNRAPVIMDFIAMEGMTYWTFEGWVDDEQNADMTIVFGGLLDGYTATTDGQGNFYLSTEIAESGWVSVQTTDVEGLESNIETQEVSPTTA